MKNKFSSMWRVGIALVMVLSLGLVMAVPVSAISPLPTVDNVPKTVGTAATYTVAFTTEAALFLGGPSFIYITFPNAPNMPGLIDKANVKVNDTLCIEDATVALQVVTIKVPKDIPAGPVTVVIDKAAAVKNPTTVGAAWKLAVGTSAEPAVDSAPYATELPVPPTLTVDITAPTDLTVSVDQTFDVTAVVVNTGPVEATTVKATIDIPDGASTADPLIKDVIPATLPVGGIGTVTWAVTCDTVASVTITVTPSGSYIGGAIPSIDGYLVSGDIAITQELPAALDVTDVTATPLSVVVGETFDVTATVKNTAIAGSASATDVKATIAIAGPATAGDPTPPESIAELACDTETTVSWTVTCTGVGDVTITVTAAGKDANSGQAIADATGETATVTQTEAAVLEVTITAPAGAGLSQVIGAEFPVTATVKNTGASTAKDVDLTLSIGDPSKANLKVHPVQTNLQTVGYLAPGATSTKTWTLECLDVGDAVITVTPAGDDVLTGAAIPGGPGGRLIPATVTVHQLGMTHPVTLEKGWNLISLPLIPADSNIDKVLAALITDKTVEQVRTYDQGIWPSWARTGTPPPNPLTKMEDGQGFWVQMSKAGPTFTVSGYKLCAPAPALPPQYAVVAGWNLIGYKFTSVGGIDKYLGVVSNDLQAIYGYKVATGYFIPTFLEPGSGYWIALAKAGTIYPTFQTFTITATAGAGGSISASAVVNYGADETFTITPDTNYEIADVLVDGVSFGAVGTYTFVNVTADHTIHATFTITTP